MKSFSDSLTLQIKELEIPELNEEDMPIIVLLLILRKVA